MAAHRRDGRGLCAIGDRLGLFKSLVEQGPATSQELAERTGIVERYAREWLQGLMAAGYLEVDPATMRYSLPAEHAKPLADEDSPLFQGGILELLAHCQTPIEELIEAFIGAAGELGIPARTIEQLVTRPPLTMKMLIEETVPCRAFRS